MPDNRPDEEKAKDAKKFLDVLKRIRQPYEYMVDEVIKFVHHGRRKITDKEWGRGKKTGMDVYDGTAISASNLATDGISGHSFSKSYHWFNYTLPGRLNFPRYSGMRAWSGKRMDDYPDVRLWLEDCEEVMYAAFLRSNFYDVGPEVVREAITIGTVNVLIEEDILHSRSIFTIPHFRECYIAENQFGTVDTRYRVYSCELRHLTEKFGVDQMKKAIPGFEEQYKQNPYTEKELIHAIFPRSDYDPSLLNGSNKAFASWYVLTSPLVFLYEKDRYESQDESGYDDNPLLTWRWRKNNDELYGRSPAWDAYVDIVKGNQQARTNLIAGHKSVDQPIIAPEDMRGNIERGPAGISYMDRMLMKDAYPRPLFPTPPELPYGEEQQDRTDKIIREHFHVDFFLMLWQAAMNKVQMTATQVIEMSGEKAAILGNRMGRMETEFGNPVHDRMFFIEERAGRIPMPPQILIDHIGNRRIEVDYLGPLAQAQKIIFKSKAIRGGIQALGEMSQVYPEVAKVIKPIPVAREYLMNIGFPVRHFNTDEEIDAIRQAEEAQLEAEQDVAEGVEIAKAASKLTRTVEPNSPLEAIMGGGEGKA